jgi:hypothetical protein
MHNLGAQNSVKKWARLALKCGLLLTDAKLWSAVNDQIAEHTTDMSDSVRDAIREKYETATDRLQDARYALEGRTHWVAPAASFLGGIGIGIWGGLVIGSCFGRRNPFRVARQSSRDEEQSGGYGGRNWERSGIWIECIVWNLRRLELEAKRRVLCGEKTEVRFEHKIMKAPFLSGRISETGGSLLR